MKQKLKIRRYNAEKDEAPWWGHYEVDVEPTDRVLDALHEVKWQRDGSLTLRRSCAHGVCGSDAMRINGRNMLACKVLVQEFKGTITVEPLLGFKVIKDLVVDMEPFFEKYRSVLPYLINDEPTPHSPRTTASASTTRPSASSVLPVPPRVRCSGVTPNMSAPRPSCRRTASYSTAGTTASSSVLKYSMKRAASGSAARFSTARRPALAGSRSHAPSGK